ncbi:hypothetical protein Taro_015544 [Colocasia esculenta]|uniref:Uncharacterized protein n=1 Tax=Colocasia esculenta TaxID=4460 RepID=A0A843ULJ0_COLES|nr:hypothetical protein [Colocasia esculenta]
MDLQLCVCRCGVGLSPQLFDFFLVERQLDLSSVTARLRGFAVEKNRFCESLIRHKRSSPGDLLRLGGALDIEEVFPTPVCDLHQQKDRIWEELDGKLAAVKILSWRQHRVSLTPVGGNPFAAKFFSLGTPISSVFVRSVCTSADRNLTATFAAIKVQGQQQQMVPLTPVGGHLCAAEFVWVHRTLIFTLCDYIQTCDGEAGTSILEEDIVRSDSEREE